MSLSSAACVNRCASVTSPFTVWSSPTTRRQPGHRYRQNVQLSSASLAQVAFLYFFSGDAPTCARLNWILSFRVRVKLCYRIVSYSHIGHVLAAIVREYAFYEFKKNRKIREFLRILKRPTNFKIYAFLRILKQPENYNILYFIKLTSTHQRIRILVYCANSDDLGLKSHSLV